MKIDMYLSRFEFEFQVPHQILYTTLATDEKLSLSHFHISYQKSEISWQKMDTFEESIFQIFFLLQKIEVGLLVWYSPKNFFLDKFSWFFTLKNDFLKVYKWHFLSADRFGKRYEINFLTVIFHWWPKLCTGFDVVCEIQIKS